MERYVDGFIVPIAKDKIDKYKEIAEKAGKIWKEHGALEYWECIGDDLDIENVVSFKKAINASQNETVAFSWIVFESKEHRDKVNSAVMDDERMKQMMESEYQLVDCARMAYGGFKSMVIMTPQTVGV